MLSRHTDECRYAVAKLARGNTSRDRVQSEDIKPWLDTASAVGSSGGSAIEAKNSKLLRYIVRVHVIRTAHYGIIRCGQHVNVSNAAVLNNGCTGVWAESLDDKTRRTVPSLIGMPNVMSEEQNTKERQWIILCRASTRCS